VNCSTEHGLGEIERRSELHGPGASEGCTPRSVAQETMGAEHSGRLETTCECKASQDECSCSRTGERAWLKGGGKVLQGYSHPDLELATINRHSWASSCHAVNRNERGSVRGAQTVARARGTPPEAWKLPPRRK
jgi:hypothetical protein